MDFRFALRRGSHSRLRPCMVAGVLLVAVTLGLPASASGAPSKPGTSPAPNEIPADVRASMAAQAPLVKASDEIQRAVEKEKATGFTGVAIEGDKLVLWWKARAPMPSVVAAAAATARRTAKLERRSAPYALGELRAASNRMLAQIQANPSGPVFGVAIPADGTGLIVNADRQIVNAGRNTTTTRSAMATTAASTLARAAKVQVPVTTVVQDRPQFSSREADTPRTAVVHSCTTTRPVDSAPPDSPSAPSWAPSPTSSPPDTASGSAHRCSTAMGPIFPILGSSSATAPPSNDITTRS
jgi:hypothetical protein